MKFIFNSNMLFGILLMAFSAGFYFSICHNRYKKDNFKGKVPVIITSIVVALIGLVLLIMGIVYAWPSMII